MKKYFTLLIPVLILSTKCYPQHFQYGLEVAANTTYLSTNQVTPPNFFLKDKYQAGYSIEPCLQYNFSNHFPVYLSIGLMYKRSTEEQAYHDFEYIMSFTEKDDYLVIPFSVGCLFFKRIGVEAGFNFYHLLGYNVSYSIPVWDSIEGYHYQVYSENKKANPAFRNISYTGISIIYINAFTFSGEINYKFTLSKKWNLIPFAKTEINGINHYRGIDYGADGGYNTIFSSFNIGVKIMSIGESH